MKYKYSYSRFGFVIGLICKDRRQGETLILPHYRDGIPYNEGSFTCKSAMGILFKAGLNLQNNVFFIES